MPLKWQAISILLGLESGWAQLFKGNFAKNAPHAPTNENDAD